MAINVSFSSRTEIIPLDKFNEFAKAKEYFERLIPNTTVLYFTNDRKIVTFPLDKHITKISAVYINWDYPGESGFLMKETSGNRVYIIDELISCRIYELLRCIALSPEKLLIGEKMTTLPYMNYSFFVPGEEKIYTPNRVVLFEILYKHLYAALDEYKYDDSDFSFLLKLSHRRNWRQGCAICLTDKIMGTTCTCGHTETIIFRPCGHSICKLPCFRDLIKKKIKLNCKVFKDKDSNVLGRLPDVANADLNIVDYDIYCMYCREKIMTTFEAETAKGINAGFVKSVTELAVKEFMASFPHNSIENKSLG